MGMRIGTNLASLAAQRNLVKSSRKVDHALGALASGSRVTRAGDDAAGFAIAETLKAQLASTNQAKRNAEQAQTFIQTAEGGLNEQNNILVRLRELAVSAASDTVGDDERGYLDKEFQQLSQEFDRIAHSTRFGNREMLTGSGEDFEFQVGAYPDDGNTIEFTLDGDTTASSVGVSGLGVSDQGDARSALADLDDGMKKVANVRSTFGAFQSRLNFTIDSLASQAENVDAARSNIADADIAEEVSNLASGRVLQEAGTMVLSQANVTAQNALRLLNGA
jgi:flagellin